MKEFSAKVSARSNVIDPRFLGFAVKTIWERNQRTVKSGKKKGMVQRVNGVLHIDANIDLADLEPHLPEAVLTKLKLLFTGSDPLNHPEETELVENMLKNAKALYKVRVIYCQDHRSFDSYYKLTNKSHRNTDTDIQTLFSTN